MAGRKAWTDNYSMHGNETQGDFPVDTENYDGTYADERGDEYLNDGNVNAYAVGSWHSDYPADSKAAPIGDNAYKQQTVIRGLQEVWDDEMGRSNPRGGQATSDSKLWVADMPTTLRLSNNGLLQSRWAKISQPSTQPLKQQNFNRFSGEVKRNMSYTFRMPVKQFQTAEQDLSTMGNSQSPTSSVEDHQHASGNDSAQREVQHELAGNDRPAVHQRDNRPAQVMAQDASPDIIAPKPLQPPADFSFAGHEAFPDRTAQHTILEAPAPGSSKVSDTPRLTADALETTTSARPPSEAGSLRTADWVSNDGVEQAPCSKTPDIRGRTPPQMWIEQNWNITRRPKNKSWETESVKSVGSDWEASSILKDWVHFWLVWVIDVPKPRFLHYDVIEQRGLSEACDIDTETGELLRPVHYSDTIPNYKLPGKKPSKKQLTQTSHAHLERAIKKAKRRAEYEDEEEEEEEEARVREMDRQEMELREEQAQRKNKFLCRNRSHLRPAQDKDMDEIAEIYNREVKEGWRALDQDPVSPASWRTILATCRTHGMPFIVVLTEYLNPFAREEPHQVIGFAYLDVATRGVLGSVMSNAKTTAKLFVFVEPEYRRNRIGTALIDMLMGTASGRYNPKDDSYQWVPSDLPDSRVDLTYQPAKFNPRKWQTLQVEVLIESVKNDKKETEKGEEYQFIWNWLETEFNMHLVCHSQYFGRAANHPLEPWLDRLIFEHHCEI